LSTLYFLAFCGVCAVVLGTMIDTIIKVTRAPDWNVGRPFSIGQETVALIPIASHDVEPRHSGFVGLTNDDEFQMTA